MTEVFLPPVMGLFFTGYLAGEFLNYWRRRRATKQLLRWCVLDPSDRELDDILKDPDHAAFLISQLGGLVLSSASHK